MDRQGVTASESAVILSGVIIRNLLRVGDFTPTQLKTIRLVCRSWCEESLKLWRETAQLVIKGSVVLEKGIRMQKYLQLYQNSTSDNKILEYHITPFKNYVLRTFDNDFEETYPTIFWRRIGPLMNQLSVQDSGFVTAEDLRKVAFQLTPNLCQLRLVQNFYCGDRPDSLVKRLNPKFSRHLKPNNPQENLVQLWVELTDKSLLQIDEECLQLPISWMELLVHFPKIQELSLHQLSFGDSGNELREIFTSMEKLRRKYGDYYFLKLEKLRLWKESSSNRPLREFPHEVVLCLSSLELPLKELHIDIGNLTDDSTLKEILQLYSKSLESFTAFREWSSTPIANFPFGIQLQKLIRLVLKGAFGLDMGILKQFANLKELVCKPRAVGFDESLDELTSSGITLNKLKSFDTDGRICSADQVRKLGVLMPNLTQLTMGLENKGFGMACEAWQKLESLTVDPFQVDETGFLGIQNGVKFYLPNITHLKDLKRFHMLLGGIDDQFVGEVDFPNNDNMLLTRDSVQQGILSLEKLVDVELYLSPEISKELHRELEAKFPRGSII